VTRVGRRKAAVAAAIALMLWGEIAQAQWVFLARRAVGRVEQMSQTSPKGDTAFDTATVIVDVPADKVFETVQRSIRTAQGLTVTREDAAARRIEFTDGARNAGIQAISLGDSLTQLMVSSAHSVGPDKPTSQIVERIITVCRQMNVECSRGS
jgi:hypothetical protein